MNLRALVRRLDDLLIELTLDGDKLRYRSKNGPPPLELIAEMKQYRGELVSVLSRREALRWPLPRHESGEAVRQGPLSWAQRRVWATSFFRNDGAYNMSGGLRLVGTLDQAAFEGALTDVHLRHPSLRTVFTVEGGAPRQHILSEVKPAVIFRDFSGLSSGAAMAECLRESETTAAGPLPLRPLPPVRMWLYRLTEEEHIFLVVLHHLIADGVSIRVLMNDLAWSYSARVDGQTPHPPAHGFDMIDYARFEEEYVQCADLSSMRRYWQNLLRGSELGPLPLPPPLKPLGGETGAMTTVVDAATTMAVRRLATASRSSLFVVVSAALSSMLSRFTGSDDLVIGMPVARRDRTGLKDIVGLLVDMVPIRLDLRGNPNFLEMVRRVRTSVMGALANAVVPVELALEDQQTQHPAELFFNVVFTDNGTKLGNPQFRGLETYPVEMSANGAKFDLNFLVRDDGDTLVIDVEFERRVLLRSDVLAMVGMARRILAEGAANRQNRLLDLASASNLFSGVPAPPATAPSGDNESLFSRLAAVAELRGDGSAISYNGDTVSYRAFYQRASQIARWLRQLEQGEGDVVAISLPRGIELVAAMIGVMGSGAACLIMNEAWPPTRVRQLLQNARVRRIIAPESDPATGQVAVSQLGELASDAVPLPPPRSSAIAYLICTSGSTGEPKIVQVPHRNVLSLLDGANTRFLFGASDTWTLFHSCSFDFSIWEIFGCLLTGGRLVVVPRSVTCDPETFAQLLQREQVTVLNLTPSALWASIASLARDPSTVENLCYLIFGGEALPPGLAERWYRQVGGKTRLINMYGITETTVHASWRWLEGGKQPAESAIGEALPGVSLYVLQDNGNPVHDRCIGEIYVGGAGVAAGYLGQPGETATRFVPDPFSSMPGARMYRSGDLARRNGPAISYLGRRDNQVQVNGFRVELSEIEAALVGQPGVAAAAAAIAVDSSGAFLVANVVADGLAPLSTSDLLHGVRTVLPRYMVPASVTVVPELPLTANGKLDRAAVAASRPLFPPVPGGAENSEPRDRTEAVLLELFREVLHTPSISTAADFFDHGGDSMRAIRLVSLAGGLGLTFGVKDIYAQRTVKHLAAQATFLMPEAQALPERPPFSLLPAGAGASFNGTVEDAYPMTALQFGMIYLQELAPESGIYHIVLSYRIGGRMDPEAFRSAAQMVTGLHAILRTSFDPAHPHGPVQRVHSQVTAPVEFEDLQGLSQADRTARINHVVQREQVTGFDLAQPGLFRLVVLTLSNHEYQLLFTHHHAILDGWSVNIFFEDLHTCYLQELAGKHPADERVQNIFADYVGLEQRAMEEPGHLEFWRARTSPELGLLIPNRSGQPVMRQVRVDMREGMFAGLRLIASQVGVPVKALLLAAHLQVVAWLSGCDEVVTGSVINCRPEMRNSDRALGLFLNPYPVRIHLAGRTWAELAREVHLDEQNMMPHRWYPHAQIQQHHGAVPMFDTYFNFTEFHTTRRLVSELGLNVLDVNELESTHYALGSDYTVDVRTGELRLVVEYDNSALDRSTAVLFADAHQRALAAMLADPGAACISSLRQGDTRVNWFLGLAGKPGPDDPVRDSAERPPSTAPLALSQPEEPNRHDPNELLGPLERSVRSVWLDVLGPVQLDLGTNFFNAGGTSLAAMRVVSRLRLLHGVLSIETFLRAPTIAGLARCLASTQPIVQALPPPLPACDAHSRPDDCQQFPLTLAQKHLWELASELPQLPLFGMPGALRVDGHLDFKRLERTFALLIERHGALRTRFATSDAGPVQIVEPHADLNLEVIDLRASADPVSECEQSMALAVLEPLDLVRSPLVRAIAFRIADDLYVIYLNIHHIVCDGVSLASLMREAAQVYRDLSSGGMTQFCHEPRSCGELAQAEVEWTGSTEAAQQRCYWADRLAPPWPSLAGGEGSRFGPRREIGLLERLRPANSRRLLPEPVLGCVRAAARQHALTEFMVVLTALASTLRLWSGQNDIRVATMMANRVHPDRESAVGLLANTVVLRLNVESNPDLLDLSRQAQRVCMEAFDRQQLPFENVLESLKDSYSAADGFARIFEVMLLMQLETPELVPSDGLRWLPYTPKRGALSPPIVPTTCDFVLAVTVGAAGLVADLQYTPATLAPTLAELLLDDIALSIGDTARALWERT